MTLRQSWASASFVGWRVCWHVLSSVLAFVALTCSAGAAAQSAPTEATGEEVPPPPNDSGTSATVETNDEPPPARVASPSTFGAGTYGTQPSGSAQSYSVSPSGNAVRESPRSGPSIVPVDGSEPYAPRRRRGERLEDPANVGEVVDLMISAGAYGVLLGNSVITWTNLDDTSFDPTTGRPIRSADDVVRARFMATLLGASLSLTGLLAQEAPRGVPTTMAMGLRYGVALSAFGAGAAGRGGTDVDGLLAAMTIGGLVGLGIGAGFGYGLRPHVSRSRFVETGFFWGTALGGFLAAAFSDARDGHAVLGGMLAGSAGAMLAHGLIASLTPVHLGRGWLMNAAFAGGSALGAFFAWGFGGSSVSASTYFALASATGFVALAAVFALTDGLQDPGWDDDESVPLVLRSLRLDVAPTQDGAVGVLRGEF